MHLEFYKRCVEAGVLASESQSSSIHLYNMTFTRTLNFSRLVTLALLRRVYPAHQLPLTLQQ
jgi:hypothetical protein